MKTEEQAKQCWFFHKWGRWSVPIEQVVLINGKKMGSVGWQNRECLKCGLVQERCCR